MDKADVLVVGGGPAGVVAAITARKSFPSKRVTLIRQEGQGMIPCGIPYVFRRLDSVDGNLMSDSPLESNGVNLIVGRVGGIDPAAKEVTLENGGVLSYDRLVLALGSETRPIPIPGADMPGVWPVRKDYGYLKGMRDAVLGSKKAVIVGGGFIGVEFAEELGGIEGLEVSIVEMGEHCLGANFDEEFAVAAEGRLGDMGVSIHTGRKVREIGGDGKVEYVELDNGDRLPADLVIMSVGARPNVGLAREAGIRTEENGGIWVDEYLRTSVPDVFAVGDCAQTKDSITGRNVSVMLASVAASEARIAASNLYGLEVLRENRGTVGVFSTCVGGLAFGTVGLTERRAREEGIDCVIGAAQAQNHHPGKLPDTGMVTVKLMFSRSSGNVLLGGEITGPESAGEMLNILAMSVQQEVSLFDFVTWQIATHPLLTPAPTAYPIIAAAQEAILRL